MYKAKVLVFSSLSLIVMLVLIGGNMKAQSHSADRPSRIATQPSELPSDIKTLELDKPVADSLEPDKPGRFYKFEAKTDQLLRLSVEPKTRELYAMLTILDTDLQTIYGGTEGEAVIGGSIIVRAPTDGTYIVSVDYSYMMIGKPTAGAYEVMLSEFTPK